MIGELCAELIISRHTMCSFGTGTSIFITGVSSLRDTLYLCGDMVVYRKNAMLHTQTQPIVCKVVAFLWLATMKKHLLGCLFPLPVTLSGCECQGILSDIPFQCGCYGDVASGRIKR